MPENKVRVKDDLNTGGKTAPLVRPKNVSDVAWAKAINLYNVAKSKGDKFPELTVAQAALETGWFKHVPADYNYFGQKGKGVVAKTQEVSNGKLYTTSSSFQKYSSLDESVDYRLKKWGAKYKNASTVGEALYSIWSLNPKTNTGVGYATSNTYDKKIGSVLNMMGVTFDAKPTDPTATIPTDDNFQEVLPSFDSFDIESGLPEGVVTQFKEALDVEAEKEERVSQSEARQRIEDMKESKRQLMMEMMPKYDVPVTPETRVSEVPYDAYLQNIDVQTSLPNLPNIFQFPQ